MTAVNPDASRQAVVEAALVLLERMGLSPADLTAVPQRRKPVPTFAEYVPVVSAAVGDGTWRAYGSYWNRVVEHRGGRRLDEPTPSEIRQLMAYIKPMSCGAATPGAAPSAMDPGLHGPVPEHTGWAHDDAELEMLRAARTRQLLTVSICAREARIERQRS
jgi:hypothetical protein